MQEQKYARGDWVASAGVGIIRVSDVLSDGSVELHEDRESVTVPAEKVSRLIRPLVNKAVAEEVRSLLKRQGSPSLSDDEYERSTAYKIALKSNDLKLMATVLAGIFAHPRPGYPEKMVGDQLADAVFGELAQVLSVSKVTLRSEARAAAGKRKLPPDPSMQVSKHEPIPDLESHEALGAFVIDRKMIIGELGYGLKVQAKAGVWYAYFLDMEDAHPVDVDRPSRLLAVHSQYFKDIVRLTKLARPEKDLPIEGASMAIVDAEMMADSAFEKELEYGGSEIIQKRGAQVRLGGDGRGIPHIAWDKKKAILVIVIFS